MNLPEPTGPFVEIFETDPETTEPRVTVMAVLEGDTVKLYGNEESVAVLEVGIKRYPTKELLTPEDGEKYLMHLHTFFRSPYFYASNVKFPE